MKILQILKIIFSNICIVFKNFIHWTLCRVIIVIFSFFLAFVSFLPFLLLVVILGFLDPISWGELFVSFAEGTQFFGLITAFSSAPFFFILESLIIILGIGFAIGVFSYKSVLIYRLLESYTSEKRLTLRENLHFRSLKKYIAVFPRLFLYLSLPVLLYIVYFFIVVGIFGGFENVIYVVQTSVVNPVSISLLLGSIICGAIFIYIYYRFIFSYVCLAQDPTQEATEVLKKSRSLTKGMTMIYILASMIMYAVVMFPTSTIETTSEQSSKDIGRYLFFRSLETLPTSVSMQSLGLTYENYEEIQNLPDFIRFDLRYKDTPLGELESRKITAEMTANIFSIINFLLFFGMFEIIIWSLYRYFGKETIAKQSLLGRIRSKLGWKEEL